MGTTLVKRTEYPEEVLLEKADSLGLAVPILDRRLIKAGGKEAIINLSASEAASRIKALLAGVFRDLGIKDEPTKYDGIRLLGYIENNHPKFTTADIKEAFELFLAGGFEGKLPERHDHYQQFSVAFYARIFKSYAQAQSEARHNVRLKVQKRDLQLAAPSMPPEVSNYRSLEIIRAEVATALELGGSRFSLPGFTYDTLVRLKVCRAIDKPTSEELEAAAYRLKHKKGHAMAFTWTMQRILAGERVDDVEWEAMTEKKMRWMIEDIRQDGAGALAVIDAELNAIRARAAGKGINLETAA